MISEHTLQQAENDQDNGRGIEEVEYRESICDDVAESDV